MVTKTVNLSIDQTIYVAAGIVRWARGEEYGVETLVMDEESRDDLDDYHESVSMIICRFD